MSGSAKLTLLDDVLDLSGGLDKGWGSSDCATTTASNTCTWIDGKCHSLWVSDIVYQVDYYIRRRCNDNGDYTAWSKDFSVATPATQTRLGCAAMCGDTSYPGAIPAA